MKALVCNRCGATTLQIKDGFAVCEYCGTTFLVPSSDTSPRRNHQAAYNGTEASIPRSSSIELGNDIDMLLEKCRKYPQKAKMYANLVLDLDPDNQEALKYI